MGANGHAFQLLSQDESSDAAGFSASHVLRQMATLSPDMIYVYDRLEQCYPYVSGRSREVLGYAPHEMRKLRASDVEQLIHPEDRERVRVHYARQANLTDEEVSETTYRVAAATGEYRTLRCRQKVFSRNEMNQARLVLGHATDITRETKRAAEIETLRGRLLAVREEERLRVAEAMDTALQHLSAAARTLQECGQAQIPPPASVLERAQMLLTMATDDILSGVEGRAAIAAPELRVVPARAERA